MLGPMRRIITGFGIFFLISLIGVIGYKIAGWDLLDAIYMVVITVFGVGFGEVAHVDAPLRFLTMFIIVAGYVSAVYTVGAFIQFLTEGEIQRMLGERRQNMEIEHLRDHVIICGYGRLGQPLARELKEAKVPFVVIDGDEHRAGLAKSHGHLVITGNAHDEEVLESAGIAHAKTLATVLPDDSANVFITLTARTMNADIDIIARGEYAATEQKLKAAGARRVVLPASIGAMRIAHMITQPTAVEFLDESQSRINLNSQLQQIDLRIDQFPIPKGSPIHGKKLDEIETLGKGAFLIVGIKRADGTMISSPPKDFVLESGDTLIIVGHCRDIPQFAAKFVTPKEVLYRGVRG